MTEQHDRHWARRHGIAIRRLGPPAALLALGLAVWQGYTAIAGTPDFVLPGPWTVAGAIGNERDLLLQNTLPTMEIALIGYGMAVMLGLLCAVVLRFSRVVALALYPVLIASQTVPVVGLAPILVIALGFTILPKLIVVCLMCFFPIAINAADGFAGADPDAINLLRSMGARRWRIFREVEWPFALPAIFSGFRIAATYCVVGAIFGEWVGSSEGLGWLMLQDHAQLDAPGVFATMVVLTVMGMVIYLTVWLLERLLLPWYHDERRGQTLRSGPARGWQR